MYTCEQRSLKQHYLLLLFRDLNPKETMCYKCRYYAILAELRRNMTNLHSNLKYKIAKANMLMSNQAAVKQSSIFR